MAAVNLVKYRGFYSLSQARKKKLFEALSKGSPISIACERAGIVEDTFYRWRRIGKALCLGEESPEMPHFLPRQTDEPDDEWFARKYLYDWDCAQLQNFFISASEIRGEARFQLVKNMWHRAFNDKDMYANAWLLERTIPEEFALVTTNRKEIDVRAEVTHKHQAELLAEAFALLGPANPALTAAPKMITLPEGDAVAIDPDHD